MDGCVLCSIAALTGMGREGNRRGGEGGKKGLSGLILGGFSCSPGRE